MTPLDIVREIASVSGKDKARDIIEMNNLFFVKGFATCAESLPGFIETNEKALRKALDLDDEQFEVVKQSFELVSAILLAADMAGILEGPDPDEVLERPDEPVKH